MLLPIQILLGRESFEAKFLQDCNRKQEGLILIFLCFIAGTHDVEMPTMMRYPKELICMSVVKEFKFSKLVHALCFLCAPDDGNFLQSSY